MSAGAVEDAFSALTPETARTFGARLYLETGLRGIRGEVAGGFPSVLLTGLPTLRALLERGVSMERAGVSVLLALMARTVDTNLIARGGPEGQRWAAAQAAGLLAQGLLPAPEAVEALGVDLVMGTADRMGFLDALEALSARQKEALWRGFLQDGTQPMEFQWLWDAYREGAVDSLLEWELTLQLTLEALGFAVVNGAGRFTVTGPDGSARSFDLIRGGPAEKLFLKILFPLDKRE